MLIETVSPGYFDVLRQCQRSNNTRSRQVRWRKKSTNSSIFWKVTPREGYKTKLVDLVPSAKTPLQVYNTPKCTTAQSEAIIISNSTDGTRLTHSSENQAQDVVIQICTLKSQSSTTAIKPNSTYSHRETINSYDAKIEIRVHKADIDHCIDKETTSLPVNEIRKPAENQLLRSEQKTTIQDEDVQSPFKFLMLLGMPPGKIQRPTGISNQKYYKLIYNYNCCIDYCIDQYSYSEKPIAWNIYMKDIEDNTLSLMVKTALQLHIISRAIEFPSFLTRQNIRQKASLKMLQNKVIPTMAETNNFIKSKINVLLSIEYTKAGKFGKAYNCLMKSQESLLHTEHCEYHGWHCLASAVFYDSLRRCFPRYQKKYEKMVFELLNSSYKYFIEDNKRGNQPPLESVLDLWFMFLTKARLTDAMPMILSGPLDSQTMDKLSKRSTPEKLFEADKLYKEFQRQMAGTSWLSMKDKYTIFPRVRDVIKEIKQLQLTVDLDTKQKALKGRTTVTQQHSSTNETQPRSSANEILQHTSTNQQYFTVEKRSQKIESMSPLERKRKLHDYFINKTKRDQNTDTSFIQMCIFDELEGETILFVPQGYRIQAEQYVKKTCPLVANRVKVEEVHVEFAHNCHGNQRCTDSNDVREDHGNEPQLSAIDDTNSNRLTYGQLLELCTFGSEIMPVCKSRITEAMNFRNILWLDDVPQEYLPSMSRSIGTLGCFVVDTEGFVYAVTCQHVISKQKTGLVTSNTSDHFKDIAILTHINGHAERIFELGNTFWGILSVLKPVDVDEKVLVYSRTNVECPVCDTIEGNGQPKPECEAISLKEKQKLIPEEDTPYNPLYTGQYYEIDIAVIKMNESLQKSDILQTRLKNSNGEEVELQLCDEPIKHDTIVQKYGGVTGWTKGRIVASEVAIRIKGWQLRGCYVVRGIDGQFAKKGDSGALVTTEISEGCKRVICIGLVYQLWTPVKKGPTYAICVDLKHCLQEINRIYPDLNLKLLSLERSGDSTKALDQYKAQESGVGTDSEGEVVQDSKCKTTRRGSNNLYDSGTCTEMEE